MAVNPPLVLLSPGLAVPMGLLGEAFLLRREGVDLTVKDSGLPSGGLFSVRCTLYLTTARLAFVPDKPAAGGAVAAVDVPLQGLRGDPDFVQPILGANYLSLAVAPVPGRGLRGDGGGRRGGVYNGTVPVRATFTHGGCATFLHYFWRLVERYRVADVQSREAALAALAAPRDSGSSEASAFFDPSDPSVVYLTQPSWTSAQDAPHAPAYESASSQEQSQPAVAPSAPAPVPGGFWGVFGTIGRSVR